MALVLATFVSFTTAEANGNSEAASSSELPGGLTAGDWNSIQEQIDGPRYHAFDNQNGGYVASNPAHGWQIDYAADGTTTLRPHDQEQPNQAYRLDLKLSAIGYQNMTLLAQPQAVNVDHHTVTYQWNQTLREWWINSPEKLEQWFEIQSKPLGQEDDQWLRLHLNTDTDLAAEAHGDGLQFSNTQGIRITYTGLKVWDASGQLLIAKLRPRDMGMEISIDDRNAIYPVTIDPSFVQLAYLKASNTSANDQFGRSVAVSGNTVVVGAGSEDSNGTGVNSGNEGDNSATESGAAYVFVRDAAGDWAQQAYLKASNTGTGDRFGTSVAISGDTVVVGANTEDSNGTGVNSATEGNNSANISGAAYVFVRDAAGDWAQQAYLKASNTGTGDRFGTSVAISGDTVVVGAFSEDSIGIGVNGGAEADNSATQSGAAYVFVLDAAGDWTQQAYLKASNTDAGDYFGYSVAVSGDTAVVGARLEDSFGDEGDDSGFDTGAAYVFVRNGGGDWIQQAYLKAFNIGDFHNFGWSVAVSGNTAVIGAPYEDSNGTGVNGGAEADNSAFNSGAGYVFARDAAGNWTQQAYLKASNTDADDNFGYSVAVTSDTAVVGAPYEGSNGTGVNGEAEADDSASSSGAAYVFSRDGAGDWAQQAYLKASNTGAFDVFGWSVTVSGDFVLVGALVEDSNGTGVNSGAEADNSAGDAGAAYAYFLDTVAPIVAAPADITMEATGPTTSAILGTATATDNIAVGLVITADNIGPFAVGIHTVSWSATDTADNTGTAAQTVTITDTTLPAVSAPADVIMEATGPTTSVTLGTAGSTDLVDGAISPVASDIGPFAIGIHTITWSATDTAGNIGTATQTVAVTDTTAPVITITGTNPQALDVSDTYTDSGATASDLVDGDVTASIVITGIVDISTPNNYVITYTVADAAGNTATATRAVNVSDFGAPVITLPTDIILEATSATTIVDLGTATVTDNVDTDLIATVDNLGPFTIGIHTITWSATDTAGNTGTAAQTVTITDTAAPEMLLLGEAIINLNVGDTYTEAGATASDLVEGDLTAIIVTTGTVDTGIPDSQILTYSATDSTGNTGVITRTVNIGVIRSYTGTLPSGNPGTISFTTSDTGCSFISNPRFLDASSASSTPPNRLELVDGLVSFVIENCTPGATVTVSMDYGQTLPGGARQWKAALPWYALPSGRNGSVITFTLTDGGEGDDDNISGTITDPSGAGVLAALPVPALNQILLGLMIGLILLIGFGGIRLRSSNT